MSEPGLRKSARLTKRGLDTTVDNTITVPVKKRSNRGKGREKADTMPDSISSGTVNSNVTASAIVVDGLTTVPPSNPIIVGLTCDGLSGGATVTPALSPDPVDIPIVPGENATPCPVPAHAPENVGDVPSLPPTAQPLHAKKRRRKPKPVEVMRKIHGNYDTHADCHPGTKNSLSVRPSYFNDARVSAFLTRSEWFEGKTVLDVGCNAGYIALATAQLLKPRSVEGLDIDPKLIHKARQLLSDRVACLAAKTPANSHEGLRFPISCGMPAQPPTLPTVDARNILPFNVSFRCEDVCANAATNSVIVHQQYDVIVCLKVAMHVHLNHGDDGVKRLFRRLHSMLRDHGKLILEYQSFRKYRERRHVTEVTAANYAAITFYPDKFESFLLREVGFRRCTVLDPITADLKRPLFVFCK